MVPCHRWQSYADAVILVQQAVLRLLLVVPRTTIVWLQHVELSHYGGGVWHEYILC